MRAKTKVVYWYLKNNKGKYFKIGKVEDHGINYMWTTKLYATKFTDANVANIWFWNILKYTSCREVNVEIEEKYL